MIVLTLILLLMGLFSTMVAIVYEDLSMLIPAGLCYLSCGIVLVGIKNRVHEEEDVPEWEHLEADHCGSVCPNSGVCDSCEIGFP